MVKSGDGTNGDRGEGKGDGVMILMEFEDIVDAAKMGKNPDGCFAVVPKQSDDAIVANAVGMVGLQGSHILLTHHDHAGRASRTSNQQIWLTGEHRHSYFRIDDIGQANPFVTSP